MAAQDLYNEILKKVLEFVQANLDRLANEAKRTNDNHEETMKILRENFSPNSARRRGRTENAEPSRQGPTRRKNERRNEGKNGGRNKKEESPEKHEHRRDDSEEKTREKRPETARTRTTPEAGSILEERSEGRRKRRMRHRRAKNRTMTQEKRSQRKKG
ncbi:conglutin beta 5-like [Mercurialis annua]|uniref:conglutin beta 5-like n=1 Tax=Mercurialis annua TaxID=3986 RepID=UPI00215E416F|nr:conglutin beta 5-like [Mercurialis annua]